MAKEVMLQIKMDADLKEQAEFVYRSLGTSFAEAVRIFAKQSIEENAARLSDFAPKRRLGLANGKYSIPDDIDGSNAEIAEMFGVDEL